MSEIWSVHVEARIDGTGLLDESAASRLLTLTQPHHGSVAAGGDPPRWAATVSLEAASATEAVGMATRIVVGLAAEAGLPHGRSSALRRSARTYSTRIWPARRTLTDRAPQGAFYPSYTLTV